MRLRLILTLVGILCVGTLLSSAVRAQDAGNYQVYTAITGDTITSVADAMKVTEEGICSFNQLNAGAALAAGDMLVIPSDAKYVAKPKPAISAVATPATTKIAYEAGTASATAGQGMSRFIAPASAPISTSSKSMDELVPEIEKVPASGNVTGQKAICTNEISLIYLDPECKTVIWDKNTRGKAVSIFGKKGSSYAVIMADGSIAWMRKSDVRITNEKLSFPRVAPPAPVKRSEPVGAAAIIETAKGYLGMPYKYGGNGDTNIDCSLFVQQVFADHGAYFPRTAHEQAEVGTYVALADLQPGDRVYFNHYNGGEITHTGIYIGDGKVIHASSSGKRVMISDISVFMSGSTLYAWAKR